MVRMARFEKNTPFSLFSSQKVKSLPLKVDDQNGDDLPPPPLSDVKLVQMTNMLITRV
jgi:hypothetical protein